MRTELSEDVLGAIQWTSGSVLSLLDLMMVIEAIMERAMKDRVIEMLYRGGLVLMSGDIEILSEKMESGIQQ